MSALPPGPDGQPGGYITKQGYIVIRRRYAHVILAEKALGKPLPPRAEVHHVNEIKSDNRPSNLVVCPDRSYHYLLHKRALAINSGFPAHYYKCAYCGEFDDPANMYVRRGKNSGWHTRCGVQHKRRPRTDFAKKRMVA